MGTAAVLTIDVTALDDSVTRVRCIVPDLVRAERHFNLGSVHLLNFETNPEAEGGVGPGKIEHVTYIAWCALRREHGSEGVPKFEEWLDGVARAATVDLEAEAEAARESAGNDDEAAAADGTTVDDDPGEVSLE